MRNAQTIQSSDWIPPCPARKPGGMAALGRRTSDLIREASLAALLAVALSWGLGELVLLLGG